MSKRTKRIILAVVILQFFLVASMFILPKAVLAIPGRYRVALAERSPFLSEIAEGIIGQVAPVEALPAPDTISAAPRITIPAIPPVIEITATIQPTLIPTAAPTKAEGETEDVAPTPTLQATPSPTLEPTATPSPVPLPRQVRLSSMPRIQQKFNNCGPANLTQVLNWYGDETTQVEAAEYLKPNPEDRNVSPWQLSDYVNEFTELSSTVHANGDLDLLKRLLAAGFPVVVEKGYEPNIPSSPGWYGHYLTVFGYDEDMRTFNVMDSYLQVDEINGRSDSYDEIEFFWQHFNNNFYVVYEPEQEEEVFAILGPELLEPLKMWEGAAIRAQEQIDADPENAYAWFNLGTSLTRMGEITGRAEFYQNGAAAFDHAFTLGLPPRMLWYEFRPYLAYMKVGRYDDMVELADAVLSTQGGQNVEETYLYKGHALLFLGDAPGAIAAYERALELNNNFYPAEIALQSLS